MSYYTPSQLAICLHVTIVPSVKRAFMHACTWGLCEGSYLGQSAPVRACLHIRGVVNSGFELFIYIAAPKIGPTRVYVG